MLSKNNTEQPTSIKGAAECNTLPHVPSAPGKPKELAILIHGTFAGDASDIGSKWWQSSSEEAKELQQRLPKQVRIAEGKEVFHWSGDNGERARSKAAVELLEHLKPLEESKQNYHLVGHSHGGSVIWNAIRLATLTGQPLRGMRSWSTVGTPFLHHCSRSPWHIMNVLGVLFGLALFRPAFAGAYGVTVLIWKAICGHGVEIIARSDEEAGYIAVLRAPFLAFVEWFGVPVEKVPQGVRLGGFDPSGDLSLFEYIFATREGLILLAVILFCVYVFLHVAVMCIRPAIEAFRTRSELRLQRRAFSLYGSRWLGLWSPDDEAINGLRATLDLSMSFVKKMAPSERVYITDSLSLLSRPYYWVLAPLYNRLLRPLIDSTVSNVVVRSLQGNDRPSVQVVAVGPSPVLDASKIPPLPEHLSDKILHDANRHACDIAPKLRQLLGCPSFSSGLETFSEQLSGNELVHTSYFNHGEVLDLLTLNMDWDTRKNVQIVNRRGNGYKLTQWFQNFKKIVVCEEEMSYKHTQSDQSELGPKSPHWRKAS